MSMTLWRAGGALGFIVTTVAVAKASQYAAIARLGPTIGFDAASLLGAAPVVIVAAALQRRRRGQRPTAAKDHPNR